MNQGVTVVMGNDGPVSATPEERPAPDFSCQVTWQQMTGGDQPFWLVRVYSPDGKLLDTGMGFTGDATLAEVLEHLLPPNRES